MEVRGCDAAVGQLLDFEDNFEIEEDINHVKQALARNLSTIGEGIFKYGLIKICTVGHGLDNKGKMVRLGNEIFHFYEMLLCLVVLLKPILITLITRNGNQHDLKVDESCYQ